MGAFYRWFGDNLGFKPFLGWFWGDLWWSPYFKPLFDPWDPYFYVYLIVMDKKIKTKDIAQIMVSIIELRRAVVELKEQVEMNTTSIDIFEKILDECVEKQKNADIK